MKLFNAIQIVTLLVLGPVLIPLLKSATFFGASATMYVLAAGWICIFFWAIAMVYDSLSSSK